MVFVWMASELSAVASILIYEVAVFEQLVLSGEYLKTARLLSLHRFLSCCCLWREITIAVLLAKTVLVYKSKVQLSKEI